MMRSPTIESKRVFVEVVVQMLMTNSTVMCAQHPSFQQGGHSVAMRQQIIANLLRMANYFMSISKGIQLGRAFPSIGMNYASWSHSLQNGFFQAVSGGLRHTSKSNPVNMIINYFCRYYHQALSRSTAPSFAWLLSPNIRLIHFHSSRQPIPSRHNHSSSQFMQPSPCCFIAPKSQYTLQSQGTGSRLLTGNPSNRPKPHRQRLTRAMKNCSCCYRDLVRAVSTLKELEYSPAFGASATQTNETLRPAQLKKIAQTNIICREASFKFCQCARIVLHTQKYYILYAPESKG